MMYILYQGLGSLLLKNLRFRDTDDQLDKMMWDKLDQQVKDLFINSKSRMCRCISRHLVCVSHIVHVLHNVFTYIFVECLKTCCLISLFVFHHSSVQINPNIYKHKS